MLLASTAYATVIVSLLARNGRIALAHLAPPLSLALALFGVAALLVARANALAVYWLGAPIAFAAAGASWGIMSRTERNLLLAPIRKSLGLRARKV
jgi:hypothetical protein